MAAPKGFKKDLKLTLPDIGRQRREQLLGNISENKTYLPRSVMTKDMDESFIQFIEDDISPTFNGKQLPAHFFVLQRWSEFQQTWRQTDEFKNLVPPFITIVRSPNTEVGTNQAGNWNIPEGRSYAYMKAATWSGNRKGIDIYKIPQPTAIDLLYEVRLFANKMNEVNRFQEIIQKSFISRQHYIFVKGHPMPVTLESIDDETRSDIDERRYYVIVCNMRLAGYILDDEDMEVVPAKSRALIMHEIQTDSMDYPKITLDTDIQTDNITYEFFFKQGSKNKFSFNVKYNVEFYNIDNKVNIQDVKVKKNGKLMTFPFIAQANDTIKIEITRNNGNQDASLNLKGTIKS